MVAISWPGGGEGDEVAQQSRVFYAGAGYLYPTPASALAAAGTGDAVFLIAPGTYPESLALTGSARRVFSALGFAGIPLVNITGQITWTVSDGSQVDWKGCVLAKSGTGAGPLFQDDIAAGTGNAHWGLEGGYMGPQTTTVTTHTVNMSVTGDAFAPVSNDEPADEIVSTIAINGTVSGTNAVFSGNVSCHNMNGDRCYMADGITLTAAESCVFRNSECGVGVTVAFTATNKTLYLDTSSGFAFAAATLTGTGAARSLFANNYAQAGSATLSSGVSPSIAATVVSGSIIVCTLKTPSGTALSVKYAALAADRTIGAPGSFKISALVAAGTVNSGDSSVLDWVVVNP